TFYDFFNRLWENSEKNLTNHIQPPRAKVKKPKGKGQKADGVETETTEELLERLSITDFFLDEQPYATLFAIFQGCFLNQSVLRGVIHTENLTLSGDGTPVVTAARERGHKICGCASKGVFRCSCPRFFSQPDRGIGWNSSRNLYYPGYDLCLISDTRRDLPLFPLFHPASKHDSHGFCEAFFRFLAFLPAFKPSRLLLDSAHDATAIYTLCQSLSVVPFIDLNPRNAKKSSPEPNAIQTGSDGVPVCPAGLNMKPNGADLKRRYLKFRCPRMQKGKCVCDSPCSSAKFGRTFSVAMKTNPRLYNFPPRRSPEWKKTYNAGTASERANKRMKNDYHLELGHHRSTQMRYVRLYAIVMSLRLDAWGVP
ncbi:MAG: transposase, partial [Oscillibacter sp.]|nr:transposase [Oscillibacter sp.]